MRETPVKRKEKKVVLFCFCVRAELAGVQLHFALRCCGDDVCPSFFSSSCWSSLFPAAPARSLTPTDCAVRGSLFIGVRSLSLAAAAALHRPSFHFSFLSTHPSDETGKVQSSAHFLTTFQTTFTSVSPLGGRRGGRLEAFRFFGGFILFF